MLNIKTLLTKLVGHYNNVGQTFAQTGSVTSFTAGSDYKSILYDGAYGSSTAKVTINLDAGIWWVMASARFAAASNTYRGIQVRCDDDLVVTSRVQYGAASDNLGTQLETACIVSSSATWNLDVECAQNSTSMTINWYIRCVRIK